MKKLTRAVAVAIAAALAISIPLVSPAAVEPTAPATAPSAARSIAPQEIPAADAARAAGNRKIHIGDDPDDAGPLATDLSPDLAQPQIVKAMRKVADRELANAQQYFGNSWTWCTLYAGLLETARVTGDSRYLDPLAAVAEKYEWKLGKRLEHADDHCIAQLYLELYVRQPDEKKIAPTRAQFDQLIALDDGDKWTWCDALFMAPPAWVRLAKAAGDRKYLDYADRNWWQTTQQLYDPDEHLFYRDAKFLTRKDPAGRKVFWSRGNGWVMGGLARVIPYIPADDPNRPKYVTLFKQMSARLVALEDDDGMLHASVLSPDAYPLPETSGTALTLYGLAWGINEKILDRATYEPAVRKSWKGLLAHVYADGRLGCVQQTGDSPAYYKPTASYNYGVGGFLLAGSEMYRLAGDQSR